MISSQYVAGSPGSVSVTSSVTSISPAKRKADVRVYDVPIEKPTKKMRKKKTTKILVRGLLLILYFWIAVKSSVDTKIISLPNNYYTPIPWGREGTIGQGFDRSFWPRGRAF